MGMFTEKCCESRCSDCLWADKMEAIIFATWAGIQEVCTRGESVTITTDISAVIVGEMIATYKKVKASQEYVDNKLAEKERIN